ncbi:MAG: S41 family peptidase [Planctomycetaceae bacterium]|nr:S41 family peptidase [Planctomycetaceae bacterium]
MFLVGLERRLALRAVLGACIAFVLISSSALVGVSAEQDPANDTVVRQAIDTGVELERSRQWRDAIDHYKQAVKDWPDNEYLKYGLRRSKFHFSIDRRYADTSFRDELRALSFAETFALFDEVLDQVRDQYVDSVSTTWFVAHGTESLWLSLANEHFLEVNAFGADAARVQELRDILRDQYWNKRLRTRGEAHTMIREVADRANRMVGINPSAVILEYAFGGCNGLDDYSSFLTPGRYRDLNSNIDGEFVGIGIVMEAESGNGLLLVDVLPKSPAFEQGLRAGEFIVEIDGKECRHLTTDEAAGLLTGVSGSAVRLGIQSDSRSPVRRVVCPRRAVKVDSIPIAQMIDGEQGIGYIRMTGFQKNSPSEMDAALATLSRQGMRSLIWDLRGNPGGLLSAAVEVSDRFLSDGRIVSTRGRSPDQNLSYSANRIGTWNIPLVLLIDENSASASEIVAGAMRDHQRGKIVGRQSFGKWSVQTIYPASRSTGLRLTTAKFYSPNGDNWSKIGVRPDIEVTLPAGAPVHRGSADLDVTGDEDIQAALRVLREPQFTRR